MPLIIRRRLAGSALALAALAAAAGAVAQNAPQPVMPEDQLSPQWNERGARVASCPAFRYGPQIEHLAGWGWAVVEFRALENPDSETRDYDNPASPTGATRVGRLRVKASVLRSSGKLPPVVTLRYITERAAVEGGQPVVAGSDPLDGRPGRAPITAGLNLFAIVFPDPYLEGEFGLAAVFAHEDELVSAITQGAQEPGDFDALAAAIDAQRAAGEALELKDPRTE
ncbi:MAG TPA: hypothetical protein VFO85_07090 [Vicinamibacteria bacterium]|nr:hypothetical protein [Vicinamibacteria bacterium]